MRTQRIFTCDDLFNKSNFLNPTILAIVVAEVAVQNKTRFLKRWSKQCTSLLHKLYSLQQN